MFRIQEAAKGLMRKGCRQALRQVWQPLKCAACNGNSGLNRGIVCKQDCKTTGSETLKKAFPKINSQTYPGC